MVQSFLILPFPEIAICDPSLFLKKEKKMKLPPPAERPKEFFFLPLLSPLLMEIKHLRFLVKQVLLDLGYKQSSQLNYTQLYHIWSIPKINTAYFHLFLQLPRNTAMSLSPLPAYSFPHPRKMYT